MPAINISAVNTGTETLTATAHGMLTGQRFRLRNTGGALPAATPSLGPVLDRFAIRVDADNFKAAATSADAFTGTAINITGAGTGTHILEYGLPYCIPTALAAAGTQVKSADANGTWNALVALYDLLTGQAQSVWSTVSLVMSLSITGDMTASGTVAGSRVKQTGVKTILCPTSLFVGSGGATSVTMTSGQNSFPIQGLFVGQRVVAVRGYWDRPTGSSPSVTMRLNQRANWQSSAATVATGTTDTATGGQVLGTAAGSITGQTLDVTAGKVIEMTVTESGGTGLGVIYGFEIDVTEP